MTWVALWSNVGYRYGSDVNIWLELEKKDRILARDVDVWLFRHLKERANNNLKRLARTVERRLK